MGKRINMSTFYSPLRYPGGKNCIFQFMSKMLQENNLQGIAYAEPYAGGAGLALRLLMEEYVSKIYINDYDGSIYAFWDSVVKNPDELCNWISDVEVSVDNWRMYKEVQRNAESADLFDLAKATFFLNRTNVSGILKGGIIGGADQKGALKINARFNKDDLINRIQRISRFQKYISVSNLDGLAFIDKMNKKKQDIFIYLDPPYYKKGSNLYMNYYSKEDHEKLSRHIRSVEKPWLISYDNHDFILNLYAKRRKILYSLSQSTSNRVGNEILIFSKNIKYADSISYLKSPVII